MGFGPQLVDFNGDGHTDIISGSWPGELYFFERLADGKFSSGTRILGSRGKPIKSGSASAVFAVDWDDDGDLDLLVGTIEGYIHLITNVGTTKKPAFGNPQKLSADGRTIRVSQGDAGPCVADWDGDGKQDLLVGCGDGSVGWYRNIGSHGKPKLAAAKTLVPKSQRSSQQSQDRSKKETRGTRSKICVTDWNGDGHLDLLVGDFAYQPGAIAQKREDRLRAYHGWVWLFQRKVPQVAKRRRF